MEGAEHSEVLEIVRSGGRSLPSVRRFDARVDEWFEPLRQNRIANRAFYLASEAADFSTVWHLISAARAVVFPRFEASALRLAVALPMESALVNGILKQAVRRTRPTPPTVTPHAIRKPRTSSFPSGHASAATMAAVLLSEGSRVAPLWWSAATLVATSRIHTRMHHASDVLAGVMVGAALAAGVKRVAPLNRPRRT